MTPVETSKNFNPVLRGTGICRDYMTTLDPTWDLLSLTAVILILNANTTHAKLFYFQPRIIFFRLCGLSGAFYAWGRPKILHVITPEQPPHWNVANAQDSTIETPSEWQRWRTCLTERERESESGLKSWIWKNHQNRNSQDFALTIRGSCSCTRVRYIKWSI